MQASKISLATSHACHALNLNGMMSTISWIGSRWQGRSKTSIALMKDLVCIFSKLVQPVQYPLMGALSTAKPCTLAEKLRWQVEGDKDRQCFEKSIPNLLEVYASQLLNQASDLAGVEKLIGGSCLPGSSDELKASRGSGNLGAVPGFPSTQAF